MTTLTKAAQDALEVTLYECVACEHLYQHKVSQCDCLENHDNEYREWIAKPKATNSAALQDKAVEVPADVARDAGWFRLIRDGSGWPAVFASHDAPEPLRGDDLDAAMIAAAQAKGDQP